MKPFTVEKGPAAPLLRNNVDTDLIIRVERIAQLARGQLGPWLLETLRYREGGPHEGEQEGFVLNQPAFRRAPILLAGANFGCGSSREMAVWALEEFGIRCVIAPSFGDIFYANCLQNGLLPIVLDAPSIARLADIAKDGTPLEVDLRALEIRAPGVPTQRFEFDQARQQALIEGLDEIDQTLRMKAGIDAFRAADRGARSWAYPIL
ncbi:3-isopropylmalate dehydratase small subunit [Caballeronia glathei]|jgi:3-isopropylmalate/(R)-2-methylmalate dehydratase small subunit|uniref:3-isopropylmalate dehydratase n=1 Tax=Caballeronia glathei TaxID=60547 RepID=A0A069PUG4_9BURK|nr:3-isopropylmalate dehydratase small subunit [Caballeronia glathei]KDR40971.1 3-isopropylmalate dehydratase [Caballeronia glathei]CDY73604.1 3-isopropylmalate dehydratase small subunit [Caballeronia glathei]